MKITPLKRRTDALARPETAALLDHLLGQRSPTRVRVVRERLALSANEFALALRSLERHGLVKRLRLGGSTGTNLNQHLFIEATEHAFALRDAHPTGSDVPVGGN